MRNALYNYVVRLADDRLILGHRLSEWCGYGPELEIDLALGNLSLDHIGQARLLYQYAATLSEKDSSEDEIAYLRTERQFTNLLLVEQPNGDFAHTVARSFYFDHFNYLLLQKLADSADITLQQFALKAIKEVEYHVKWSTDWVIRLGDGTEESKDRMQKALENLWPYVDECFDTDGLEKEMLGYNIGVALEDLKPLWLLEVTNAIKKVTLMVPEGPSYQKGGRKGIHTENLGKLLAEMQYLQRTYPNCTW